MPKPGEGSRKVERGDLLATDPEVDSLRQLGHRDNQSPNPGVQVAVAVAVALVGPPRVARTPCISTQQIRPRLDQLLLQELGRVDSGFSRHRRAFLEWVFGDLAKIHAVTAPTSYRQVVADLDTP
jgi:hypothetical protein